MFHWSLCHCIIFLALVGSAVASDVPFIFDKNIPSIVGHTSSQLEHAHLSSPALVEVPPVTNAAGNATLKFPVVGGGSNPHGTTSRKVDDLRNLFDSRVEPENSKVHELAINIAGDHPGDCTIDQIDDIFGYLVGGDDHKKGWSYIGPPRGVNNFFYANQTIKQSENKDYVGAGDCGDFAILMSALVESIGGTTRIIMASNNTTGGHAYAQVYIGRDDVQNSETEEIIKYLQQEFDSNNIFANVDTDTKDIWLNLDWWPDQNGSPHPGGPLFTGEGNLVIYIRKNYPTNPIMLPKENNKPPRLISLTPDKSSPQAAASTITWTAEARDPEKDPIFYRFLLNDDPITKWIKNNTWAWSTSDSNVGANTIEVQVRDGKHALANGFDDRKSYGFNITLPEPVYQAPEYVRIPLLQESGTTPPEGNPNATEWYKYGISLYVQGNYNKAIQAFDNAIRLDPSDGMYDFLKGNCYVRLGDYGFGPRLQYMNALICYNNSIEKTPYIGTLYRNKGIAYERLGKYDNALICFNEELSIISKTDPDCWYLKGKVLQLLGRNTEANNSFEKAIEDCNDIIKRVPQYSDRWWLKGKALQALGRIDEANAASSKAEELNRWVYKEEDQFWLSDAEPPI
jgi:hypothetical protein